MLLCTMYCVYSLAKKLSKMLFQPAIELFSNLFLYKQDGKANICLIRKILITILFTVLYVYVHTVNQA